MSKAPGSRAPVGPRSELWQRLRAARQYSDKTQEQIAKALGVTRAAEMLLAM